MRTSLILVALLAVCGAGFVYFSADGTDRQQWQEARARWHADCDTYVDKPVSTPEAKACAQRMDAMMAYAKQRGW